MFGMITSVDECVIHPATAVEPKSRLSRQL
jgi:hypothetical protein